jgi:hypothetical protein
MMVLRDIQKKFYVFKKQGILMFSSVKLVSGKMNAKFHEFYKN